MLNCYLSVKAPSTGSGAELAHEEPQLVGWISGSGDGGT